MPVDLTKESFDAVEDVQTFTLQASQLAVVVASYDKTIGRICLYHSVYQATLYIIYIINEINTCT